jgi:hypothetical protein
MILRNIDNAKSKPKSLGNIEACFQEEENEEEYNELEEQHNEWYRTHELGNCDATEIDIY